MRRKISVAVIVLIVLCLILTCVLSIYRAKHMPQKPEQGEEQAQDQTTESGTESESESESDVIYTDYTGEAHPGTGIVYRGSGANANTVIVIDAGHQLHAMSQTEPNGPGSAEKKAKVTGGTQGSTTGLAEYELNLRVALALRDALVAKGYCVVMVRETHEVEISNAERAQLANKMGADVNIRIHANGDSNPETKGAMTVCQTAANPYNANIYKDCRALSDAILSAFCQSTGMAQRSVWETDTMTGTNWATVPTTILEMGFMTNPEDDAAMAAEGFAASAAEGIVAGIEAYLADKQETTPEQTTAPDTDPGKYEIDYEMEASFGKTFTETYVTMRATGNLWVRSEPSSEKGMETAVGGLKPGETVVVIGIGNGWNRVLYGGKVCYASSAYLEEIPE